MPVSKTKPCVFKYERSVLQMAQLQLMVPGCWIVGHAWVRDIEMLSQQQTHSGLVLKSLFMYRQ